MVMLGLKLTGKLPFREVYLHAVVRDAHGRKMSKSLGNVIDPLDVISGITLEGLHAQLLESNLEPAEVERARQGQKSDYPAGIPECGTDALRFALCAYTSQEMPRHQPGREPASWATGTSVTSSGTPPNSPSAPWGPGSSPRRDLRPGGAESLIDRWILSRLSLAVELSDAGFRAYDFPAVTTAVYNFWLYELCDVYLECLKPVFAEGGGVCGDGPPAAPSTPAWTPACGSSPPSCPSSARSFSSACPAAAPTPPPASASPPTPAPSSSAGGTGGWRARWSPRWASSAPCAPCGPTTTSPGPEPTVSCSARTRVRPMPPAAAPPTSAASPPPAGCGCWARARRPLLAGAVAVASDKCTVHLLLKGLIDAEKEISKLAGKQGELQKQIERLQERMETPDYGTKVPPKVQEADAAKLQQSRTELQKVMEAVETFQRMI
ncbi:unnamed protein product [Eretmochelys imbricata]